MYERCVDSSISLHHLVFQYQNIYYANTNSKPHVWKVLPTVGPTSLGLYHAVFQYQNIVSKHHKVNHMYENCIAPSTSLRPKYMQVVSGSRWCQLHEFLVEGVTCVISSTPDFLHWPCTCAPSITCYHWRNAIKLGNNVEWISGYFYELSDKYFIVIYYG